MTQSWSVAVRQRGSGELATEKPALASDRISPPPPQLHASGVLLTPLFSVFLSIR